MIDKKTKKTAKEYLGELTSKVKLTVFSQEFECEYCKQTVSLAEDIAELSDRLLFEEYDLVKDQDKAKVYKIDKIPAIVISDEGKDYGIRFFGLPSGYEFISFLEALKTVGTGEHGLSSETVNKLSQVNMPVDIQVFVTPTCPYCPRAVTLAHKMAYISEHVTSAMVEAIEFPQLVQKYQIMGVPKSVVNETGFFEGALPEKAFVEKILNLAKK
jgi:glutaredoxin-like protein